MEMVYRQMYSESFQSAEDCFDGGRSEAGMPSPLMLYVFQLQDFCCSPIGGPRFAARRTLVLAGKYDGQQRVKTPK